MPKPSIYYEQIIKLAAQARQIQPLPRPATEVIHINPMCGDEIRLSLDASEELLAIGFEIRGCLLCQAASARMKEIFHGREAGKTLKRLPSFLEMFVQNKVPQGLEPFAPVKEYRARHSCVLLPFEALREALPAAGLTLPDDAGAR